MNVVIKNDKKVGLGILAGISTGLFWGLPFLVPQMLPDFSSLEISFGRFFFFGLISLLFLKKVIAIIRSLSILDRILLMVLSASGFWFYSILLFWAVHQTGGIISSLIVGLLPISITLTTVFGKGGRKQGGLIFFIGLSAILVGLLVLFGFPVFMGLESLKPPSVFGVLALFSCLALWTWFAINNTRFLQRNPEISGKDFASVIGVVSLVSISPFFLTQVNIAQLIHRDGFNTYLWCSIALGFGSSWLANWLWNVCSFHCPSEISGPLIISETVCGLLYSFIFENRFPHGYEAVAITLFLSGAFMTVRSSLVLPGRNRSSL